MKVIEIADGIKIIELDYNGIAKVLSCFIQLYKVADNKKIVDECLLKTITAKNYLMDSPMISGGVEFDKVNFDFFKNEVYIDGTSKRKT